MGAFRVIAICVGVFLAVFLVAPPDALAATPTVKLSVSLLTYPSTGLVGLDLTAPAQTVTVTNTGTVPLQMLNGCNGTEPCLSGSYAQDFAITANSCGANTIAVNSTCTVSLNFTPRSLTKETATLTFYDNTTAGNQTVALTGQATAAKVSVSVSSLTYPSTGLVGLDLTAPAQTVTVTNTGTVPLQMLNGCNGTEPCLSGSYAQDFAITANSCGANTIAVNSTCTVSLNFTPRSLTKETATLTFYDNTTAGNQTVALTGQATAAKVSVSVSSLTYPSTGLVGLDLTAPAQTVTVTNTGTVPLQMLNGCNGTEPCLSGSYAQDFAITANSCGANTIAVNSTCTVSLNFTPRSLTKETATLTFYDNTTAGNQTVALTGQATAATASLSGTALSLFSKQTGQASPPQTVTVTNTGTVPLQMLNGCNGTEPCLSGSYAQDFSITANSCAANTIAVNTSCTVSVNFTPSTLNKETATLTFYDNTTAGSQTVALTGLATTGEIALSKSALTFPTSGAIGLGQTSSAQTVTVTNTGTVAVQMGYGAPSSTNPTIGSTYPGDFKVVSNTCAQHSIAAGSNCTFSVSYTASTLSKETATLTVYDNAIGGPHIVTLSGQATAATASLSTTTLTFASQAKGTTSAPQTVKVTNTGTVPLLMGYGLASGTNPQVTGSYAADFIIENNSNYCSRYTIAAGSSCTFTVEFKPATTNVETGSIDIYDNTSSNPQVIGLQGTGK